MSMALETLSLHDAATYTTRVLIDVSCSIWCLVKLSELLTDCPTCSKAEMSALPFSRANCRHTRRENNIQAKCY